jgi:hypothetical protein
MYDKLERFLFSCYLIFIKFIEVKFDILVLRSISAYSNIQYKRRILVNYR